MTDACQRPMCHRHSTSMASAVAFMTIMGSAYAQASAASDVVRLRAPGLDLATAVASTEAVLSPRLILDEPTFTDQHNNVVRRDPRDGKGGTPATLFAAGRASAAWVVVDLGKPHVLTDVFLFHSGAGEIAVDFGAPGSWSSVAGGSLASPAQWTGYEVKSTTRYLRLRLSAAIAKLHEVVLYGVPADKVSLGFNLGPIAKAFTIDPVDGKTKIKAPAAVALDRAVADGFRQFRFQDPFSRGFYVTTGADGTKTFSPSRIVDAIRILVGHGADDVLVSLGNFPFESNTWTYRYFPEDLETHQLRMREFLDHLRSAGLLSKVRFELFNEPDAPYFYWDDFDSFRALVTKQVEILKDYMPKEDIVCCGFTSDLMTPDRSTDANTQKYWQFVNGGHGGSVLADMLFSFHWYPSAGIWDSSKRYTTADIGITALPSRTWITEFNIDAYMTKPERDGTDTRPGYRADDALTKRLRELLVYSAHRPVDRIYMFNLFKESDEAGVNSHVELGLFNAKGFPEIEYERVLSTLGRDLVPSATPGSE